MSPLREAAACQGFEAFSPLTLHFPRSERVCERGELGVMLRVARGAVRLNHRYADGTTAFGGPALAGDAIGHELLALCSYCFPGCALTPLTVEAIDIDLDFDTFAVSELLATTQQRTAHLLALTRGAAAKRVRTLLTMIAASTCRRRMVALPTGRDIAEITGLTIETVSRQISAMRRSGELVLAPHAGWGSAWSFRLCRPVSRTGDDDRRDLAAA
jgi:CRP/FNR family transcriptional regulator